MPGTGMLAIAHAGTTNRLRAWYAACAVGRMTCLSPRVPAPPRVAPHDAPRAPLSQRPTTTLATCPPASRRAGVSWQAFRRVTRQVLLLVALPWAICAPAVAAPDTATPPPGLQAVVDGPQRSAANRARDRARHPVETLAFFGLKPNQTVIEIAPGGGWYTEILAPYLRDHGRLVAAHYAVDDPNDYARRSRTQFDAKLAAAPKVYGRVVTTTLPVKDLFTAPVRPASADLVLTFRNVHNWIEAGHLDETLRAIYAALKPGGVLGVEEHRAPVGTPLARVIASGYVPEELVIARAKAAGFALLARSEVNANPRDTKDHANGVWSLPPTLRGTTADDPATRTEREKFLAIGESDRMTLTFRKPLH